METDAELLQRYADGQDQRAFSDLVQRHFELVFGSALRRTGGRTDLAAEIAQSVFTDLARKAPALRHHPTLAGWLYRSTRYASSLALRHETRRRKLTESLTAMAAPASPPEPYVDWERLRPVIDEAMDHLKEPDREILLLRHFSGLSFADAGIRLKVAENAARMRHERALEKLRLVLGRRGITSTSAALSLLLANASLATAPAGLATTVSTTALAAGTSAAGSAIASVLLMHKLTFPVLAAVLASALSVAVIHNQRKVSQLETAVAALHRDRDTQAKKFEELAGLMTELLELEKTPVPLTSSQAAPATPQPPTQPLSPVSPESRPPAGGRTAAKRMPMPWAWTG